MQLVLGTVPLPVSSKCFHVLTWPWCLAMFNCSRGMLLWNSFLISFSKQSLRTRCLFWLQKLWAGTPGRLRWSFSWLMGDTTTWRECRQKNKGVEAGERTFTSLFPDLSKAQSLYHSFVRVLLNKLSLLWLCWGEILRSPSTIGAIAMV